MTSTTGAHIEAIQRESGGGRSKSTIWLGVLGAAVVVLLGGLAFQLLTGNPFDTSSGRVRFDYSGVRSRFFRRAGKFLVETDGPDGKLAVFEVYS